MNKVIEYFHRAILGRMEKCGCRACEEKRLKKKKHGLHKPNKA